MKEPWQMTKAEWDKEREAIRPETFGSSTKHGGSQAVARINTLNHLLYGIVSQERVFHRDVIKKAIAEGKPIPQRVLKDYK